jgi:hypothetical protein
MNQRTGFFVQQYAVLIGVCAGALAFDARAQEKERVFLPSPPKKVQITRHAGTWTFKDIPSPGTHYDELEYDVTIGQYEGRAYMDATLTLTPERDDRITMPYVRLLYTNGVEFAMLCFSNATFWSTGRRMQGVIRLPHMPQRCLIACGYGYYYDMMYEHMQGGPKETIVDSADGTIISRGEILVTRELEVETDRGAGLMFLGDTLHVRAAEAGTSATEAVTLDYNVFDSMTGRKGEGGKGVSEVVFRPVQQGNYLLSLSVGLGRAVYWRDIIQLSVLPKIEKTTDPAYLGRLAVNDSIACGLSNDMHQLQDGRVDTALGEEVITERLTGSRLTNVYGGMGRLVSYDRGFFGYTLGINMKWHMPYLLEIEYPEDAPRTMAFLVGNTTYAPGIHTGNTIGQPEPRYFAEQLDFPLSRAVEKVQFIVWAGDREVNRGLYVGVADPGARNAPFSKRPLLLQINLYEFLSIACVRPRITFDPVYQRYAWVESEDMLPADEVRFAPQVNSLFYGLNAIVPAVLAWNAHGRVNPSVMFPTGRYRQRIRRVVKGVEYETTRFENPTNRYDFWEECLKWADTLGLAVFPRFEYGGTDLLPEEARGVSVDGAPYPPHIRMTTGARLSDSVDVCNPATREDMLAVLDECLDAVPENLQASLRNLIVRRRADFMSTSYTDTALRQFEQETGVTLSGKTAGERRQDAVTLHLEPYQKWYQSKILDLLAAVNKRYTERVPYTQGPLLYHHWREPGMPYEGVYYETEEAWEKTWKARRALPFEGLPLPDITCDELVGAVSKWTTSEEGFFTDLMSVDDVQPVMPLYGAQALTCTNYFALFDRNGLQAVKIAPAIHSSTRIRRRRGSTTYAGRTLYHPRQFSMFEAVRAAAYANPAFLGFEQAHPPTFPYPVYARRFFANFLSLPAVPMPRVPLADVPDDVVVRMGTLGGAHYLAVINTGFEPVEVRIALPLPDTQEIKPLVGDYEPIEFFVTSRAVSFDVSLDALELLSYKLQ